MKTEQELKDKCTPEFIKWMCEMAEGFDILNLLREEPEYTLYYKYESIEFNQIFNYSLFPLLIHRAVEGWNKNKSRRLCYI